MKNSKKNIWVGTKDDGLFRLDRNGVQINYKDGPFIKTDFPAIISVVLLKTTRAIIG